MTQRPKQYNTANLTESINYEKLVSKMFQKHLPPMKPTSAVSCGHKCREKGKSPSSVLIKPKTIKKQQNIPAHKNDIITINDDGTETEISRLEKFKLENENERWSDMLKTKKVKDVKSTFSNCDPLRTLHFLSKELQYQLQTNLPDDSDLHQMVIDMQNALKRVPPEVASTIHLQQAIDSLPVVKKYNSTSSLDEKPEKLERRKVKSVSRCSQTTNDERDKIQQIMKDSTVKLESSCRQMEILVEKLKIEKDQLDKELKVEKDSVKFLKKRVSDLEDKNKDLTSNRIKILEMENSSLRTKICELDEKISTEYEPTLEKLKHILEDLKNSKIDLERECNKLRHKFSICTMEKEKYIAALNVRTQQVSEIRSEMAQLQEVVNEQLMELHNGAFTSIPSGGVINVENSGAWEEFKENAVGDTGDGLPSTIHGHEDHFDDVENNVFKEVPSGDTGNASILQEKKTIDSQQNIHDIFEEIKNEALKVMGSNRSGDYVKTTIVD